MTDWMMWLALAGLLVIVELFTGTFYILMIAVGATAGVVAALGGASGPMQIVLAAVVGVIATGILHRSRNEAADARASFEKYLEMAPNAPDAALIKTYLTEPGS